APVGSGAKAAGSIPAAGWPLGVASLAGRGMIVADSSALIEYYRRGGSPAVQEAVAVAIADDALAFNGIIFVEVVGFAADERERQALLASFGAFRRLALEDKDFEL